MEKSHKIEHITFYVQILILSTPKTGIGDIWEHNFEYAEFYLN